MKQIFITILKGVWIGGTLTVPGASGGSMAMILGIYEQLLHSFNAVLTNAEERKKNIYFLLQFSFGAGIGMILLSGIVVKLLKWYPAPMTFFFMGAVAGGIPVFMKDIGRQRIKGNDVVCFLSGVLVILLIALLPSGIFAVDSGSGFTGFLLQFLGGILSAIALVLPGISVSHMLYILGIYEGLMYSISTFQWIACLPFGIGLIIGVVLSAGLVERFLSKYRRQTYLIILGFVAASVVDLFSFIEKIEMPGLCFFMGVAGFFVIYMCYFANQKSIS